MGERFAISRRAFLAGAATLTATGAAADPIPKRIAIIDWALLETVLALGVTPTAATELLQFRKIVIEPEVPADVVDLGLRGSPNYELLRIVAPDLILISNFYEPKRRQLARIAPTLSLPVHQEGTPPFQLATAALDTLANVVDRRDAARRYLADTMDELERIRTTLTGTSTRRAFVIMMGDQRHLQAFGSDSMFGDVLARLGVENAWTHGTRYSAAAPVSIEALASDPNAAIFIVSPLPPAFQHTQRANALWQAIPAVQRNRVAILPSINNFGGLPTARRFARLFAAAAKDMDKAGHG